MTVVKRRSDLLKLRETMKRLDREGSVDFRRIVTAAIRFVDQQIALTSMRDAPLSKPVRDAIRAELYVLRSVTLHGDADKRSAAANNKLLTTLEVLRASPTLVRVVQAWKITGMPKQAAVDVGDMPLFAEGKR